MKLTAVVFIIAVALFFDYTNGFHDAANSIATVVSTRVLTPRIAVIWAALFNFVAFLVFKTHVANTVGKTVDPEVVSEAVIFAGLVGAIAWNFLTWWLGLPTSSSHALTGGWRIVKTLGQRITALKPVGGFSAETAAAISLYLATHLGIPVSTTHTITGAIVGVGATRRLSAVRWGVARSVVLAWILTIPGAFAVAFLSYAITVSRFALIALV